MPSPQEQDRINVARANAQAQVDWYSKNKLYYKEPPKEGRASWGIALHPHFISPQQYRTLRETTPKVIADYHRVSTYLLSLALEPGIRRDSWTLSSLYNVLTYATPPETEVLWKEMIAAGKTKPASSRPDILIPQEPTRPWQHIEYNADGSADKGNTLGVAKVTQEVLGFPTIGIGLDIAFMKGLRRRLPDHDQITVATVVPSAYRTEYTPQNEFFAKQIDGRDSIRWISASLSQMEYRSDGVYTDGTKVDIVDREFKAPGFSDDHDFAPEMALYKAVLENKVEIFGSALPYGDKIFLATLFDANLEPTIVGLIGQGGLQRLRTYHPTTHLLSPNKSLYTFGNQDFTIRDLKYPGNKSGFVLKHTGDNTYTTGSNGVYFSHGYQSSEWPSVVESAHRTGVGKRTPLIIQELVYPQPFPIETITSTTAEPKSMIVPVRFAPYYIDDDLGDALVTAGTDREVEKLNSFNIHGQKKNSYQGVSVKEND